LADIFFVFAKPALFQDLKDLLILIVDKEIEGVKVERNETKLGMKGTPLSAVSFEEVRLTRDCVLAGGGNDSGRQFKKIMGGLNISRLGAAAIALGLAQAAIDGAVGFIRRKGGMGDRVAPEQGVQFILADGEATVEAIRALIYQTAERMDRREGNLIKAASVAKYFATEGAMKIALNTFQICRSYGLTGDDPMERILRDLTCTLLLEGTSQIHQTIIARELMKTSMSGNRG
jgi:alkylation response protein AidB-like acyl-CoA dehydrogenase